MRHSRLLICSAVPGRAASSPDSRTGRYPPCLMRTARYENLNLSPWLQELQWMIVGGESCKRARPMHSNWPRSLRDRCRVAGVAYLIKQHGGLCHNSGGRLLDGDGPGTRCQNGRNYDQADQLVGRRAASRLTPESLRSTDRSRWDHRPLPAS